MKAYMLGCYSDPDNGNEIVFAKTAKEARGMNNDLDPESYIDLYAKRSPEFDDMENATHKQLMKEQWRNGWWFGIGTPPDAETSTDEDFYEWYAEVFEEVVG